MPADSPDALMVKKLHPMYSIDSNGSDCLKAVAENNQLAIQSSPSSTLEK